MHKHAFYTYEPFVTMEAELDRLLAALDPVDTEQYDPHEQEMMDGIQSAIEDMRAEAEQYDKGLVGQIEQAHQELVGSKCGPSKAEVLTMTVICKVDRNTPHTEAIIDRQDRIHAFLEDQGTSEVVNFSIGNEPFGNAVMMHWKDGNGIKKHVKVFASGNWEAMGAKTMTDSIRTCQWAARITDAALRDNVTRNVFNTKLQMINTSFTVALPQGYMLDLLTLLDVVQSRPFCLDIDHAVWNSTTKGVPSLRIFKIDERPRKTVSIKVYKGGAINISGKIPDPADWGAAYQYIVEVLDASWATVVVPEPAPLPVT